MYVAVDRGSAHYYFKHLTPPLEATVECGVGEQQRRAILERVPQAANNQKVFDFTDVLGWSLLTCAQQASNTLMWLGGLVDSPFSAPAAPKACQSMLCHSRCWRLTLACYPVKCSRWRC